MLLEYVRTLRLLVDTDFRSNGRSSRSFLHKKDYYVGQLVHRALDLLSGQRHLSIFYNLQEKLVNPFNDALYFFYSSAKKTSHMPHPDPFPIILCMGHRYGRKLDWSH